jgi:hypothetical protein
MLAANFEGAREIQKPASMTDEECSGLPILQAFSAKGEELPDFAWAGEMTGGPPYPITLTYWMPSREDLDAMNAGRGIWVRFLSQIVFPMSLFTLNEAGEINQ